MSINSTRGIDVTKITTEVVDTGDGIHLSRAELHGIIESTVESTLIRLGLDPEQPFEAQKDFAYLRQLREGSAATRLAVVGVIFTGGVTALGTLLYFGVQWLIAHGGKVP